MLTTDFHALYMCITNNIGSYGIFLFTLLAVYFFIHTLLAAVTDAVVRIVVAVRAPIVNKSTESK